MLATFKDVLNAVNDLKDRGLVADYAIGGAMAQVFWDEAISTLDVDVFILLDSTHPGSNLLNLGPLYEWASSRGYRVEEGHIIISEVPVQFLPAPDALAREAIEQASNRPFEDASVRVIRPEYLIAMWLQPPANNRIRRERAERLRQLPTIDEGLLADLLDRYDVSWG